MLRGMFHLQFLKQGTTLQVEQWGFTQDQNYRGLNILHVIKVEVESFELAKGQ